MDKANQLNVDFITKLQNEIVYIRSYLYSRMDGNNKEEFNNLEKIYETVALQIKNKIIKEEESFSIYGQFLKTLKRFKRKNENILKFNERDVDAFRRKYEITGASLLPIVHDIKMNVLDRMGKFDVTKVLDHNFQMHLYSNKELCDIAFQMFDHHGYYKKINVDPKMLQAIIKEMCLTYNVVPYHNWSHAFSLFQMMFCCYFNSKIKNFVEENEFFAGQLAALAHDMNHKGVNNLFKQKKKAENSIRYSETGILESMHSSMFFRMVLKNPEFNIVSKAGDPTAQQYFKRLIVTSIMATDMGRHNRLVGKLKRRVGSSIKAREKPEEITDFDKFNSLKEKEQEDRRFILNIIVHACDIGNPCLEFDNYMNWSYLVSQEFFDQTIKEEKKGLEVTAFLKYKDKLTFLNGQAFFSKVLVLPLWTEIANFFIDLKIYPQQIENNIKRIDEEKAKLQGQAQQIQTNK